MNLPTGITGYRSIKDKELPFLDAVQFKQLSYAFVRELGGEIKGFYELFSQRNCYAVEYMIHGETYLVLLNVHHPFVAFASVMDELTFLDVPELAVKFKPYYTVLTKDYLNIPLSLDLLSTLLKAELVQISYWKTKTVGEVIFNNWD